MVWVLTARLDVVNFAVVVPPLVLSVPWPMLVPPSEKVTVPVGLLEPVAVTVAVKVTAWPHTVGLVPVTTAVLLLAFVTVWVMADDVLALKLLSPP